MGSSIESAVVRLLDDVAFDPSRMNELPRAASQPLPRAVSQLEQAVNSLLETVAAMTAVEPDLSASLDATQSTRTSAPNTAPVDATMPLARTSAPSIAHVDATMPSVRTSAPNIAPVDATMPSPRTSAPNIASVDTTMRSTRTSAPNIAPVDATRPSLRTSAPSIAPVDVATMRASVPSVAHVDLAAPRPWRDVEAARARTVLPASPFDDELDDELDEETDERWPPRPTKRLFEDDSDDELDAAEYDEMVVAQETGEYDAAGTNPRRRSVNAHVVARGRTYADDVVTAVRRYAVQVLTERRRIDEAVTAVSAPSLRKRRLATGSQPPPPAAQIARHVVPRNAVMTARPARSSTTSVRPSASPAPAAPETLGTARTARAMRSPSAVPLRVKPAASERMAAPEPIAMAPTVPAIAEQIQVAMRWSDIVDPAEAEAAGNAVDLADAEPIASPAWAALDQRIATMMPDAGRIERIAEHAVLEGRIVTRGLELVVGRIDPMAAIEKLGAAIVAAGMRIEIDDSGVGATSPELVVRGRGEQQLELRFQLVGEHDDVDLREDLARCAELAPLLPLAELGRFVTRVASGQQLGRRPHAAMSIALDDETRACVLAWLAARDYEQDGATWRRVDDDLEYAVTFERCEELGVDEATAFVRARRSAQ